jgi:NADPH2:quinone reductase
VRAVVVEELGRDPTALDVGEPAPGTDDVIVELIAAALNPVDLAVASGKFYGGHPPLPYIPCTEAVGRVLKGKTERPLVYAFGAGFGLSRNGTASERFTAPEATLIELPAGADPGLAAALGTAGLAGWLPLSWRAGLRAGETVLVLGATGTAGHIALQAARLLGAGRVVAAARTPERRPNLGNLADVVVRLGGPDVSAKLAQACAPGADIIYDLLWGEPLLAALQAARPGARVVHVGAAASQVAEIPSAAVRGKQLDLLGYSNSAVPRDILVAAYCTLVENAMAGSLQLEVNRVRLSDISAAWTGLKSGEGKFVLVPD